MDGERNVPLDPGAKKITLELPPIEQHDYVIQFRDAHGNIVHRTDPYLMETKNVQTIAPTSFTLPPLSILPAAGDHRALRDR